MGAIIASIIILSIALIFAILFLCFIIYKLLILTNEINKRLLVLAETAVTQEANTVSSLEDRINTLEDTANSKAESGYTYPSNQEYHDPDLD